MAVNEARAVTGGACGVAVLAVAGSVIPGVNAFLDRWVLIVGVAVVVVGAVWFGVQELRDWLFWREMATPLVGPLDAPDTVEPDPDPVNLDALDEPIEGVG